MDIHNDNSMACGEILEELLRKKVIVGAKQLRKALASGSATRVYLAENADPAITEPIMTLCQQNSVDYVWVRF